MKLNKHLNTIIGWCVFSFSFIIYILTAEPTVSFWDCGEFIASSYKLQIGHPPGAPFFQLIARVVSLLAPSPNKVAYAINIFSGFASAATVMFLYWTIVRLVDRFQNKNNSKIKQILSIAAGAVGALTFAFTDSFWFSAVEAEAYAFSSLFTAIVFWAILKWEQEANEKQANRWIIFIAYLVGLSIGVHLLNLLAIPAIAYIWYFKKYKTTRIGIIATFVISAITILFIMYGLVQGTPKIAQSFEILFVNSFGLPFNSGLLFFILLLIGGIVGLLILTHKKQKPLLNLLILSIAFIYIGFSSYAIIMIRSAANPPMDENNPENAYTLMKYLNRDQYGSTPIITGYYYNAPTTGVKKGKAVYYPKGDRYIKIEGQGDYKFDKRFKTFFPRMYSAQDRHVQGYKMWGKVEGRPVKINGKTESIPTFSENIRYFISYQINHMYIRYFMWNFSGRQNDIQGHGDIFNGNWLTGISFLDKSRIGHNGDQPSSLCNPKTTNKYYMLPFILGVIGLLYHYKKSTKDFWVVMLLFFMTGIAIVMYLNQQPFQPRERDYAYAGSYYAFAIWIGIGVIGLANAFEKLFKSKAFIPAIILSAIVPTIVLAENYDDHDRSGRYFARDLGKNYLNSCAKNAILFTYGDNDTFPLWYVQDVENERPDVRICNVTLLNGDWYIDQMKKKVYESDPLPISMSNEMYENENRMATFIRNDLKKPIELSSLMKMALSDDPRAKLQTQGGQQYNYFPTDQFKITVDKNQVIKTGTVSADKVDLIEDSVIIKVSARYLNKSDLTILDILSNNNWERPIYFDLSVVSTCNIKLDGYLQNEGFAYRFLPIKNKTGDKSINTEILYDNLMNKFEWGNINDPNIFIDENYKRTTEVVRIKVNFLQLAEELANEGKTEKAIKVIEQLYSVLPLDLYHASYYDTYLANIYYQLNETEKADNLVQSVANVSFEKIDFYLSLGDEFVGNYQRDLQDEINLIKQAVNLARQKNRSEIENVINTRLQFVLTQYGYN